MASRSGATRVSGAGFRAVVGQAGAATNPPSIMSAERRSTGRVIGHHLGRDWLLTARTPCGKARGDHGPSVEGSRKSALLRGPGNGRSFNFIGGSPTHGESGMGHQADLPEMRHPFLRPDRKSVV